MFVPKAERTGNLCVNFNGIEVSMTAEMRTFDPAIVGACLSLPKVLNIMC